MTFFKNILFILILQLFSTCSSSNNFVMFDYSIHTKPIIVISNKITIKEENALQILSNAFKETINDSLQIIKEADLKNPEKYLSLIYIGNTNTAQNLHLPKLKTNGFHLIQQKNSFFITSQYEEGIIYATYYFIEKYLNGFKPDEGKIIYTKQNKIIIPANFAIHEEPAFAFRQAFFPASNKLEYQQWNHTQHLETTWGCWGHNLGKLLKQNNINSISLNCYAQINGKRNDEQFCFSSDELATLLMNAIQKELDNGNKNLMWSVVPNDNSFVCQCNKCKVVNNGTESASNTVCILLNKLAKKFPALTFSTLAYATTLNPPTNIILEPNTSVMLSTIEMQKGIALEMQKKFIEFDKLLQKWKSVCSNIYIWDYPIQYTNYMDIFPNLPALQKDLQYFKKENINGVFEQGSEYNYSIFCEWKCFAISKLLWNPNIDLNEIKTNFFNQFYGSAGKVILDFYNKCETNLINRNARLDIYGSIQSCSTTYLDYASLQNLISILQKAVALQPTNNPRIDYNIHKLTTCLQLLKMQYQQWKGIDEDGYALAINETSWTIKPDLLSQIVKLKKTTQDDEIEVLNENGDKVQSYLINFEQFLKTTTTTNLIWKKKIIFNKPFDESYPANKDNTLNDGVLGTFDYSYNWLLFNNSPMDISIPNISLLHTKTLTIDFLNDPTHYIFLPKSINLYAGNDANDAKLIHTLSPREIQSVSSTIKSFTFDLSKVITKSYIRIVAENLPNLPEWKNHPTKKPSIACDEINCN